MKGYITNLGKYNEGYMIDTALTFPCTEEELSAALEAIGIDEEHEEFFFPDWDSELANKAFGEFPNLDEVNDLAARFEALAEWEQQLVEDVYDCYASDLDEALEIVERGDAIQYDSYDMADVAEEYVLGSGILDGVNPWLERYFDFAAFGRDMMIEGNFYEGTHGIIEILR